MRQVSNQPDDRAEEELRDGDRIAGRRIDDGDAERRGCIDGDVVDADARVALRPTKASYSPMRSSSSAGGSVGTSSTMNEGSAVSKATPSGSISSVTRMR